MNFCFNLENCFSVTSLEGLVLCFVFIFVSIFTFLVMFAFIRICFQDDIFTFKQFQTMKPSTNARINAQTTLFDYNSTCKTFSPSNHKINLNQKQKIRKNEKKICKINKMMNSVRICSQHESFHLNQNKGEKQKCENLIESNHLLFNDIREYFSVF